MQRPESSSPFLSLRDATFRLGERLVFEKTNWTWRRNEHWAIVGPTGSGKSLLAAALWGQLPLVGGELRYHFRPPRGLAPEETISHVGFEDRRAEMDGAVLQSRWNSLEEEATLTAKDFLSYERVMEINPFEISDRHLTERPRFERRRRRAVALLEAGPLLERRLLTLSNGERQRVQLARALCRPLRLLVLDDAFAGLDAHTRTRLHGLLERWMSTSLRTLFIAGRADDLPRRITHILEVQDFKVIDAFRNETRRRIARPQEARVSARRESKPRGACAGYELVRLRDVTVRYGSQIILESFNWTVREGESWALLGPNGSGKSTVLSLITGDNPQAYSNDIEVFGERRGQGGSIWDLKRQIGCVSPELHLCYPLSATCFEVVASGFRDTIGLFEPPSRPQRKVVRDWLDRFDLLGCAATTLGALSAGQQRLALLARALAKSPRLLILDEPCQGLDEAHRRQLIATVDGLVRSGRTTLLYVTHRPDEIPQSIKRVRRLRIKVPERSGSPRGHRARHRKCGARSLELC